MQWRLITGKVQGLLLINEISLKAAIKLPAGIHIRYNIVDSNGDKFSQGQSAPTLLVATNYAANCMISNFQHKLLCQYMGQKKVSLVSKTDPTVHFMIKETTLKYLIKSQ